MHKYNQVVCFVFFFALDCRSVHSCFLTVCCLVRHFVHGLGECVLAAGRCAWCGSHLLFLLLSRLSFWCLSIGGSMVGSGFFCRWYEAVVLWKVFCGYNCSCRWLLSFTQVSFLERCYVATFSFPILFSKQFLDSHSFSF